MKKAGVVAASVAAASSVAFHSKSDRYVAIHSESNEGPESSKRKEPKNEKFAPRFDGLRFIETLVTAHR